MSPVPCKLLSLAVLISSACFSSPGTKPDDAAAGLEPRVEILDHAGHPWTFGNAPQWPIFRVSPALHGEPMPVMLFHGAPDQALQEDLAAAPLRASSEALIEPVNAGTHAGGFDLTTLVRLEAGGQYSLAIAGWAESEALVRVQAPILFPVSISTDERAGSEVLDSWPADGTAGIGRSPEEVALHFSGPVTQVDHIELNTQSTRVRLNLEELPCADLGWAQGSCLRSQVQRELDPGPAEILVPSSVRDATGAPVGPWSARFGVLPVHDSTAPEWLRMTCGLDENAVPFGCALRQDRAIRIRSSLSEPVRITLQSAPGGTSVRVAPRGTAELSLSGLNPDSTIEVALEARDVSGNRAMQRATLRTTAQLPTVTIAEILANPLGPEPVQEYVELLNFGPHPVDLQGFSITDDPALAGDVLPEGMVLPPHARALLVSDAFDPNTAEAPVPPGTMLVRVGASLGRAGLSNRGERLALRARDGVRVSGAPARSPSRAGACIVRVSSDPRAEDEASFADDPSGGCSPGRATPGIAAP